MTDPGLQRCKHGIAKNEPICRDCLYDVWMEGRCLLAEISDWLNGAHRMEVKNLDLRITAYLAKRL